MLVRRPLQLGPYLLQPTLYNLGVTGTVGDGGVDIGYGYRPGRSHGIQRDVLKRQPRVITDDTTAGQRGDILELL